MTDKTYEQRAEHDHTPQHQTDESHGRLKTPQLNDAEMRQKNLPRGSEPETRATSNRR